jgi:2-polyprenyl-6-methoxyphenol hydroxylase-like FAD-dependent oxidoreductase
MKYVIIGGGIGGLAMGIFLHKNGEQLVINEREKTSRKEVMHF